MYHRVGADSSTSVDLDVDEFERQMAALAETGRAITLDVALARVAKSDLTPGVVVSFDDGTRDFTDHAVPTMVRHGIPSILYAETGPIASGSPNASGLPPTSWAALRDAVSTGLVQIGSHTHTHRVMHTVDAATAADELDRSIAAIAEQIGAAPTHFAYPKAVPGNHIADQAVRARFRSAALGHAGVVTSRTDLCRLPRAPIQRTDTPKMVVAKMNGGMRLEGALRAGVARWRYRATER